LSHSDSKIIRAFGILNESVKPGTAQYGIPYPGTYILDPQGKVVSKYFEDDFRALAVPVPNPLDYMSNGRHRGCR